MPKLTKGQKIGVGAGIVALITAIVVATRAKAAPPPPPCDEMGDIDNDGYITTNDANMVSEYVAGTRTLTDEQLRRADVNGDGIVNVFDAMMIEQYVEGLIDTFPACPLLGE